MAYVAHLISSVFLLRWSCVERGDSQRILQEIRAAKQKTKIKPVYVAIIPAKLEIPDELVRQEIADALAPALECCRSIRTVFEGGGFRHAALRSIAAGMLLLTGQRGKLSVHDTLRSALEAAALDEPVEDILKKATALGLIA